MSKSNLITQSGEIIEALGGQNFKVELDNGITILCYVSGKMKQNFIHLIVGDRVTVSMSPYDLTRGRIEYRERVKRDSSNSKSKR